MGKAGEPGPGPHSSSLDLSSAVPAPALASFFLLPPTQRAATTQGRIFPSDFGSWPDGPQAWNKQSDGGGGGGGIWGQHPQNKRLPLCTSLAALPSSQQPPATLRPTAPGCLRGISLCSQVLWKKEETAMCDPRLNPYMNLTARELLDHFIDKETEAQGE